MKKLYALGSAIVLFLCAVLLSAFLPGHQNAAPTQTIFASYVAQINTLATQAQQLHNAAVAFQKAPQAQLKAVQQQVAQTRLAYKKIEYLAAYLDAAYVNKHLNGAPLAKPEPHSPSASILQPVGLQVLDELVHAEEDLLANPAALVTLTQKLKKGVAGLASYQNNLRLQDRHVFEAARQELVRVYTLGLTGFDTPGSLNGIKESHVALSSVAAHLASYKSLARQYNKIALFEVAMTHMDQALLYLEQNQNFDTFDRLVFLTQHVNPLYKALKDLHLGFGIETIYEVTPLGTKHSVNYSANNLFDPAFLNPYYYMQLTEGKNSAALVKLGQLLFFDPALSSNNQRACASCHQPNKAFTDGKAKSLAMNMEGTVSRNAPTLINSVYADRYFYDLRVDVLENQITHVLVDKREFHMTYLQLFDKLSQSQEYVDLFSQNFPELGNEPINKYAIAASITAYVNSLSGFNSSFDQYVQGKTSTIEPIIKDGYNLFMGKAACGTCHFAPVFNGLVPPVYHESESEVLGVTASNDFNKPVLDPDLGRGNALTKENLGIYQNSFKTPTVRNSALTGPYMHNGALKSLEEVVTFYNMGGGAGMGLDVPNQTLAPDALNLSNYEQKALVAFMQSLTDTTGMTSVPQRLPLFNNAKLDKRPIGGAY